MMTYRTMQSNKIRESLLTYVNSPSEVTEKNFQQNVLEADEIALMEQSTAGDTHLTDLINTFQWAAKNPKQNKIPNIMPLFNTLMEVSARYPQTKKFLLLAANQGGLTPLHAALLFKNLEFFAMYLHTVQQALIKHMISEENYRNLLMAANNAGFTPLQQALCSQQEEVLKVYLNTVQQALENGVILRSDYRNLLVASNNAGFTPLQQALCSQQKEIFEAYLFAVQQALMRGIISQEDYRSLLLTPTHAGFTPLHGVLKSCHLENLITYFAQIRQALVRGIMSREDYRSLLLACNQSGFTSLDSALLSENPDIVTIYIGEVQAAIRMKIISSKDYCSLLMRPNTEGFAPINRAANSGKLEIVKIFVDELSKNLNQQQYADVLHHSTKNVSLPSCQKNKSKEAQEINAYLDELRKKLPLPNKFRHYFIASRQNNASAENHSSQSSSFCRKTYGFHFPEQNKTEPGKLHKRNNVDDNHAQHKMHRVV